MATYREIHGKAIKSVSTDLSDTTAEGQVWYNTTSNTFKSIVQSEAFVSASPVITGRFSSAGAGTQTASLIAGGYSTAATDITEEYNGSGWATGGTLNQARYYIGGAGTQTSALAMSGRNPPAGWALANTEEYNGTAWTNTTASPTALNQVTTTGTQTAALLWGGVPSPGAAHVSTTYELNSESWTASGALPAGLKVAGAFGIQTAAMSAGNETGSTLYYNGSTWSDQSATVPYSGPDYWNYAGTSGTQTAGILMGGGPSHSTTTAKWDGSTWSSNPAMAIARLTGPMGPIGTSTAGLIASGAAPGPVYTTATEEFNVSSSVTTAGAWASGPSRVNTLTNAASADGTPSAWLVWGGREAPATPPYAKTTSEEFNGTAFSNTPSLNTGARDRWGGGTEPAAWAAGGTQPAYIASTEEYNGSSWSSVEDMPAAAAGVGAFGVQTAGIWVVGQISPGPYPNAALSYDGTDWTVGPALNTSRTGASGGAVGTSTAGLLGGGEAPPGVISNVEEWGGSSWTSVNSMITGVGQNSDGAFGIQTNAIFTGGKTSPSPGNGITTAQAYDGTTWTTSPSLGQARKLATDGGTASSGIITSGQATNEASALSSSEQWTPETSALNVKTLTQS